MKQEILKIKRGGGPVLYEDEVAQEVRLRLMCSGALLCEFYCIPADFRELALGYLYAEGFVRTCGEAAFSGGAVCGADGAWELSVALEQPAQACRALCISRAEGRGDLLREGRIDWDRAMDYEGALLSASEQFRSTGCIHAAALCRDGALCYLGEDISRFYALYKALGKALLAGEEPGAFVLCTTGRLPAPYMERVIRSGIGCVVSRSAPTDYSLRLARRHGVAVFGFAGAGQINYYPAPMACCLLAGGRGSRAEGADKAMLTHGGETFAQRILRALAPQGEAFVSYNRDAGPLCKALEGHTVKFIRDAAPGMGPLGGIYSVLTACEGGAVLFAPCDLPFYDARITQACRAAFTGLEDAVVVMMGNRPQPLCAIYAKTCIPVFKEMLAQKNYCLRDAFPKLRVTYVDAEQNGLEEQLFTNINTLLEYDAIE